MHNPGLFLFVDMRGMQHPGKILHPLSCAGFAVSCIIGVVPFRKPVILTSIQSGGPENEPIIE